MDDELMRTMTLRLIALLPLLLLAACSSALMLDWASQPEDRALARAAIGDLAAGNRSEFANRFVGPVRPQLASQFEPMRRALPRVRGDNVVLVDAGWINVSMLRGGTYRESRLAYEIADGDRRALVQMIVRRQGSIATITSFNVATIARPAREIYAFRVADGSLLNFAVLLLAVMGLAITAAAIHRIWTSGRFPQRWLWTMGCLVGLFRFTTVWGTTAHGFDMLGVTLFSSGAVRQGLGPWTIMAGIPVVAIWVLLRRRSLKATRQEG